MGQWMGSWRHGPTDGGAAVSRDERHSAGCEHPPPAWPSRCAAGGWRRRPWGRRTGSCRERWTQVRLGGAGLHQGGGCWCSVKPYAAACQACPALGAWRGTLNPPFDSSTHSVLPVPPLQPTHSVLPVPASSPAAKRPKNSALEVDLDFETTVKPPPQVGLHSCLMVTVFTASLLQCSLPAPPDFHSLFNHQHHHSAPLSAAHRGDDAQPG